MTIYLIFLDVFLVFSSVFMMITYLYFVKQIRKSGLNINSIKVINFFFIYSKYLDLIKGRSFKFFLIFILHFFSIFIVFILGYYMEGKGI